MEDILNKPECSTIDKIASKILSDDVILQDDLEVLEKNIDSVLTQMGVIDKFFERIL